MSSELSEVLDKLAKGKLAPIYLLRGDEFLIRKDAEALVKAVVPDLAVGLNFVTLDGVSPKELAFELSTMPLFPGRKVVVSHDPEFLMPKKGKTGGLSKAKDAWRAGRRKEGARRLLALAARAGLGPRELDPNAGSLAALSEALGEDLAEADVAFLREVAAFCADEGMVAPESDAGVLLDAFQRGLPQGHVLLLVASEVDPKHPLVKLAEEQGEVLDRKVAARLKDLELGEVARDVLEPLGKRLGPGAEAALKDRVGANMRLLESELMKLATYADGPTIGKADVELLIARVREEEFLELTDAIQKRDLRAALTYVHDALGQGAAPLQLLGTLTSLVRGLVENQERVRLLAQGRVPRSFDEFKSRVFPAIERELAERKQKVPHPYGVFMGMQSASRFTRQELKAAWLGCAEADLALKSSADGALVLERLLMRLCPAERRG
jgi:DNA polymerase-3 subunit delta